MNKFGRYDTIQLVNYGDGTGTTFFLVDSAHSPEYDCDLQSELFFNEFDNITRTFCKSVETLNEVLSFMDEHGIRYKDFLKDGTLLIGGEHDMAVYSDLSYRWISDKKQL